MEQFPKEGYKRHHDDLYGRSVFEQPHQQSGKTKQELSHRYKEKLLSYIGDI